MKNVLLAAAFILVGSVAMADVTWVETCELSARSISNPTVEPVRVKDYVKLNTGNNPADNDNIINLKLPGVDVRVRMYLYAGEWRSSVVVKGAEQELNFSSGHSPFFNLDSKDTRIRLECSIDV